MTQALTSFKAYGIESSEPTQKKFKQCLELVVTGANTDVTYDFGTYAGTFWTAAGGTTVGANALAAVKSIQQKASAFILVQGKGLNNYAQAPGVSTPVVTSILSGASVGGNATETYTVTGLLSTDTLLSVTSAIGSAVGRPLITKIDSSATTGGSATETCTVTGLLTTDTILSAVQFVDGGGAAVGILAFGDASGNCTVNSQLPVTWNADPGSGAKVRVAVSRVATTDKYVPITYGVPGTNSLTVTYAVDPGAGAKVLVSVLRTSSAVETGTYRLNMDGTNNYIPNLTFLSGNAPTAMTLEFLWELPDNIVPLETQG